MKSIPVSGIIAPTEPLRDYLSQNGVRPGPRKLAQFQQALRLRGTPALYAQDGQGDAALVHVKLFDPCGSATWYLLEWDGREEAFGYVTGLQCDEYGYVPLRELACVAGRLGIGLEIDTGFCPAPLGMVRPAPCPSCESQPCRPLPPRLQRQSSIVNRQSMLAAHYRRVSTGEQMDSLDDQEKRCLLYCSPFNQLEVPPGLSFPDPAVSRTTPLRDRKGGAALMNRLALGDVHHLIIAKLDRLGANARDMLEVFQWLKDHHITLHIIDLGGDTVTTRGYYGKLILHMLVGLAEFEVDQLRDRTQTKMRELFNSGQLTGKVPFGYDCRYTFANGQTHLCGHALSPLELSEITGDQLWLHPEYKRRPKAHKQLLDNPAEQAVIRSMAAWRASGWKLEQIAAQLNALGQPTKLGCRWSAGNVDSVLKSRHTAQVLARSAGGTSLEAAA